MTETETTGATTAPKRRRAARKAADSAESSTPKRGGRTRRAAAEEPSPTADTPQAPARSRRTRSRHAAAESADTMGPTPGLTAPEPSAPPAGSGVDAELAAGEPVAAAAPAESPVPAPEDVLPAGEGQPPVADPVASAGSPAAAPHDVTGPLASGAVAPEHDQRVDSPLAEEVVRHPMSRSRPARPTFKQTVLRAAEERFRGDRVREPVTAEQVDEMLVLLHEPGQSRSNKDATYDFLRRGMSKRHAEVQIAKLRGTYDPAADRAAA